MYTNLNSLLTVSGPKKVTLITSTSTVTIKYYFLLDILNFVKNKNAFYP